MSIHPNLEKMNRILERLGGLYSFEDILTEVEDGKMQSFSEGDSMVVTKVVHYPRKIVLEIYAAVGTLDELRILQSTIDAFAREHSCEAVMASARSGWDGVKSPGWRMIYSTFMKDL